MLYTSSNLPSSTGRSDAIMHECQMMMRKWLEEGTLGCFASSSASQAPLLHELDDPGLVLVEFRHRKRCLSCLDLNSGIHSSTKEELCSLLAAIATRI